MSPFTIGLLCLGLLMVLLFCKMPVGFAFGVSGIIGIIAIVGLDSGLTLLGKAVVSNISKEMLISIPLFILMGYFVLVSEIGVDLYAAANKWLGRMSGGLAQATTVACAGFAACTGDSMGASATMSAIAYPVLDKYKYSKELSTACIAVGGTLGILIPPSIPMLTYAYLASVSAGDMFAAGIMPGLLVTFSLMITTAIICTRKPSLGPKSDEKYTMKEKVNALLSGGVWCIISLFLLIIFGLYLGWFAPSEAGAIGALGSFLITVFRRRLTIKNLKTALEGAAKVSASLFCMTVGALTFQTTLVLGGFTTKLQAFMTGLDVSPYMILAIIIVIWLIMGMFLDQLATQFLTVPIFAPIVASLGFDLVWFGIIAIIVSEIGLLTPPVGMNAYVVSGATKVPSAVVFKGIFAFLIPLIIVTIILIFFPDIVLFLPNMMQ